MTRCSKDFRKCIWASASQRWPTLAIVLLCVNVFAGTSSAPKTSIKKEKKMPSEWSGSTGGGQKPGAQVIFSEEQWKELWAKLGKTAPAVDLKTHVAAAVFLGERPTGGFGVSWAEPAQSKDAVVLRWKEKAPASDSFVMQMITDPWAVKLFPKTAKAVRLEKEADAK